MRSQRVDTPCPMCRAEGGITLLTNTLEIPYFGEAMETTLRCSACGFRHADFMILSQREPVSLTFRGQGEPALATRVIRSNSGTVRIPELGFLAEPSQLSESYVSNVEGVLERAKDILLTALEFFKDEPHKVELLHHYIATYERILRGEIAFTLVIDDPFGNSAIVDPAVERRELSPEEIAHLKTGMTIVDLQEAAADAEG